MTHQFVIELNGEMAEPFLDVEVYDAVKVQYIFYTDTEDESGAVDLGVYSLDEFWITVNDISLFSTDAEARIDIDEWFGDDEYWIDANFDDFFWTASWVDGPMFDSDAHPQNVDFLQFADSEYYGQFSTWASGDGYLYYMLTDYSYEVVPTPPVSFLLIMLPMLNRRRS